MKSVLVCVVYTFGRITMVTFKTSCEGQFYTIENKISFQTEATTTYSVSLHVKRASKRNRFNKKWQPFAVGLWAKPYMCIERERKPGDTEPRTLNYFFFLPLQRQRSNKKVTSSQRLRKCPTEKSRRKQTKLIRTKNEWNEQTFKFLTLFLSLFECSHTYKKEAYKNTHAIEYYTKEYFIRIELCGGLSSFVQLFLLTL